MSFLQIIIILVILAAMIMVLLGIAQLGRHEAYDNVDETESLKNEVDSDDDVISKNNVFNNLVNKDMQLNEIREIEERKFKDKEFKK